MEKTIFEKILDGEVPADRVHEDEHCIAIRDIQPQAPTHVLVIPRRKIVSVAEAEPGDAMLLGHMTLVATRIAESEGVAGDGYRLVWNCRGMGGQEVPYIHLHVLGGRQMEWPPG